MKLTPFQPSEYNIHHFRYFLEGPGHFEIRVPQTISNSVIEVIVHQQNREKKENMWSGIWGWCWYWMRLFIYEKVKQWDMITPLFGFRYSYFRMSFPRKSSNHTFIAILYMYRLLPVCVYLFFFHGHAYSWSDLIICIWGTTINVNFAFQIIQKMRLRFEPRSVYLCTRKLTTRPTSIFLYVYKQAPHLCTNRTTKNEKILFNCLYIDRLFTFIYFFEIFKMKCMKLE